MQIIEQVRKNKNEAILNISLDWQMSLVFRESNLFPSYNI